MEPSAGKRGRAWKCKQCGFTGEKMQARRHLFQSHLTLDDYTLVCELCGFAHYMRTTFERHTRWYILHQTLAKEDQRPLSQMTEVRPDPPQVQELLEQLSIADSLRHWASRRRSKAGPAKEQSEAGPLMTEAGPSMAEAGPTIKLSGTPTTLAPLESAALPLTPVVEGREQEEPQEGATAGPVFPLIPGVLDPEELELMNEFFVQDAEPKTRDAATNTTPRKEEREIQRLRDIVERQARALEANTTAIYLLRKSLQDRGLDTTANGTFRHAGPGNGEEPDVRYQRPTPPPPPPKALQSVVTVVRRNPRPSATSTGHRSPLDDLFTPDVPRRDNRRERTPPRRKPSPHRRSRSPRRK